MGFNSHKSLGPEICVDIELDPEGIQKVILELSTSFKWRIRGKSSFTDRVNEWVLDYIQKKPATLQPPLKLSGSPFTLKVWHALIAIPFGETVSYLKAAKKIGHPNAYRAVGTACGKNPCPLFVPCHRVLAADGSIGGFSPDLEIKRRLLAFES